MKRPSILGPVILAVSFITLSILVDKGLTLSVDSQLLMIIRRSSSPLLDPLFTYVRVLALPLFVTVLGVAGSLLLLRRGRRRDAAMVAAALGGGALLNIMIKLLFNRARPELWPRIIDESGFSFPSWHAMASLLIACLIIYLGRASTHQQLVWATAIGFAFIVSFSRLYLGVHYPSDILGGWLAGGFWFSVVLLVNDLQQRRKHHD